MPIYINNKNITEVAANFQSGVGGAIRSKEIPGITSGDYHYDGGPAGSGFMMFYYSRNKG